MSQYHPYPSSIAAAAKLLDQVKPDWFQTIKIDIINMYSPSFCILGQLYGAFGLGISELFTKESLPHSNQTDGCIGGQY